MSTNQRKVTCLKSAAVFELPKGEGEKREAPTEFRVFPAGSFQTTKGVFSFTPKSGESVLENWKARGIPLMGDYEHQTDAESMGFPPMIAPASISEMTPEVRMDASGAPELWVTNVKWTSAARKMLEEGEYRLFSPVFGHTEDGEILTLERVAITNKPAMNDITPLVAAKANETQTEDPEMAKKAKPTILASDVEIKTEACNSTKATDGAGGDDVEKMRARMAELEEENAKLKGKLKDFGQWAEEEEAEHEAMSAALKDVTGKATMVEQVAVVQAFKASHDELTTLKSKMATDETTRLTADFEAKKAAAMKEGKLPPSMAAYFDGLAKRDAKEGHTALTAFLGVAAASPTVVTTLTNVTKQPDVDQRQADAALATVARITGANLDKVLEHSKKMAGLA